jgi:hypothetical protein
MALSQAGYLMVVFRQRTLLAPASITRKQVALGLVEQEKRLAVQESIKEDVCALLTELTDLPEKATDPNFFERLTAEEDQSVSVSSGDERMESPHKLKIEQARAKTKGKKEEQRGRRR